jgi:hypothetical protein
MRKVVAMLSLRSVFEQALRTPPFDEEIKQATFVFRRSREEARLVFEGRNGKAEFAYVELHGKRIAKRTPDGGWIVLEPGYTVSEECSGEFYIVISYDPAEARRRLN